MCYFIKKIIEYDDIDDIVSSLLHHRNSAILYVRYLMHVCVTLFILRINCLSNFVMLGNMSL